MIQSQRNSRLLFAFFLGLGLIIRIWLSQVQWIDPDEGAHLMDARLALKGLIPVVDFGSRQPVYVYVTALFTFFGGSSLFVLRLLPVALSAATGYVVFRIGETLFGIREALVAAVIFLMLPFSVLYSTQTKTGPLTMLLCSTAVLCFVRAERRKDPWLLLAASGVFAGIAFYVRQSAIAMPAILAIGILGRYGRSLPNLTRATVSALAGFVMVCAVVFAFYARIIPPRAVLQSPLNPIGFAVRNLSRAAKVVNATGESVAIQTDAVKPEPGRFQPWTETLSWLTESISLNLVLLAGGAVAGLIWLVAVMKRQSALGSPFVVLIWAGTLGLAYLVYAVVRGFYPAYFSELIPPLALLTGFALVRVLDSLALESLTSRNLGLIGVIAAGFFLLVKWFGIPTFDRPMYFVVPTLAMAYAFLFTPKLSWPKRGLIGLLVLACSGLIIVIGKSIGGYPKLVVYLTVIPVTWGILFFATDRVRPFRDFAALSMILGAATSSLEAQAKALDRRYAGLWAPQMLRQAAEYLRRNGAPGDRVLSGAVIWEFQAGLTPFLNQSHPLVFQIGIPAEVRDRMEAQLRTEPPRFIILDGYTERIYLRHLPGLGDVLSSRYRRELRIEGSPYPVEIYRLQTPAPRLNADLPPPVCCICATLTGSPPISQRKGSTRLALQGPRSDFTERTGELDQHLPERKTRCLPRQSALSRAAT